MTHLSSREISRIFESDQSAIDNRGIIGYDNSPEVLALAKSMQERMNEQFQQ